jgi:hypothetical protein
VLWFSLLMMTLLSASYLPDRLLERLASKLESALSAPGSKAPASR